MDVFPWCKTKSATNWVCHSLLLFSNVQWMKDLKQNFRENRWQGSWNWCWPVTLWPRFILSYQLSIPWKLFAIYYEKHIMWGMWRAGLRLGSLGGLWQTITCGYCQAHETVQLRTQFQFKLVQISRRTEILFTHQWHLASYPPFLHWQTLL